MQRTLISSGSTFEADIGYSRAVRQDPWVFVSGTTGYDYATMTLPPGVAEQAEQALRNIAAALAQADSSLADVVRVTYILPDASEFAKCWPVLKRHLGEVQVVAEDCRFRKLRQARPGFAGESRRHQGIRVVGSVEHQAATAGFAHLRYDRLVPAGGVVAGQFRAHAASTARSAATRRSMSASVWTSVTQ